MRLNLTYKFGWGILLSNCWQGLIPVGLGFLCSREFLQPEVNDLSLKEVTEVEAIAEGNNPAEQNAAQHKFD